MRRGGGASLVRFRTHNDVSWTRFHKELGIAPLITLLLNSLQRVKS